MSSKWNKWIWIHLFFCYNLFQISWNLLLLWFRDSDTSESPNHANCIQIWICNKMYHVSIPNQHGSLLVVARKEWGVAFWFFLFCFTRKFHMRGFHLRVSTVVLDNDLRISLVTTIWTFFYKPWYLFVSILFIGWNINYYITSSPWAAFVGSDCPHMGCPFPLHRPTPGCPIKGCLPAAVPLVLLGGCHWRGCI